MQRRKHEPDCTWWMPLPTNTEDNPQYWGCSCGADAFNLEHEDDEDFQQIS